MLVPEMRKLEPEVACNCGHVLAIQHSLREREREWRERRERESVGDFRVIGRVCC